MTRQPFLCLLGSHKWKRRDEMSQFHYIVIVKCERCGERRASAADRYEPAVFKSWHRQQMKLRRADNQRLDRAFREALHG